MGTHSKIIRFADALRAFRALRGTPVARAPRKPREDVHAGGTGRAVPWEPRAPATRTQARARATGWRYLRTLPLTRRATPGRHRRPTPGYNA